MLWYCITFQENLQFTSYSSVQFADFFRADNPEGVEARNEVTSGQQNFYLNM